MVRGLRNFGIVAIAWLSLCSWGYVGHQKIAKGTGEFFTEEMSDFNLWTTYLLEHSSDADKRKQDDKTEGPKHYIDLDGFQEFFESGTINHDLDELKKVVGDQFIMQHGMLPWATLATYDSLVSCFKREDFNKAKFFAADLNHYVSDGHMPLHVTKNYDGQFSGNKGIHGRYESKMLSRFEDEISFTKGSIEQVADISSYVFNYLYYSYTFVDTLLLADNYAKTVSADVNSELYYAALWEQTENCTQIMLNHAANAFVELLYSAWSEAGKPTIHQDLHSNGFWQKIGYLFRLKKTS